MTTLTLSANHSAALGRGGFLRAIGDFFAGAREGLAIARRYERLSRLSEAQLSGLGLSREQVPQAAVKGL